ncbi:MAG: hypothetical protein WC417_00920 [Candidatus Omnitrophota bacterium]
MKGNKQDIYRRIKIAGLISFIPFILLGAPLTGYIAGELLVEKLGLPGYTTPILIAVSLLAGIWQVIRIIKLCIQNSQT